jgi:hypothetical protein
VITGAGIEAFLDDTPLCLLTPATAAPGARDHFDAPHRVAIAFDRCATILIVDLTTMRIHHNLAFCATETRTIILDHARKMQVAGS